MKKIKEFVIMFFGVTILSAGVYFFKIPNGFVTGGVSGIGTILGSLLPFFSAATWISMLNVLLLLLGFVFLGKETGAKTIFCSLLFSAELSLCERIVPLSKPLTTEPLLELVYAILLTAFGSAILFNTGASSGGTDIVALILKKYTALDTGKALFCSDFLIAASSFFSFGILTGCYSLLGLLAKAFMVDGVIDNINSCKYVIVITGNPEPIEEYIMKTLHHGVTAAYAIGEYTGEEKKMLHTVCHRAEAVRLRRKIREIDPHAFVIITTSSEILGKGFREV